ncbi:unnamed protein product [Closterium sp. NIES-53]
MAYLVDSLLLSSPMVADGQADRENGASAPLVPRPCALEGNGEMHMLSSLSTSSSPTSDPHVPRPCALGGNGEMHMLSSLSTSSSPTSDPHVPRPCALEGNGEMHMLSSLSTSSSPTSDPLVPRPCALEGNGEMHVLSEWLICAVWCVRVVWWADREAGASAPCVPRPCALEGNGEMHVASEWHVCGCTSRPTRPSLPSLSSTLSSPSPRDSGEAPSSGAHSSAQNRPALSSLCSSRPSRVFQIPVKLPAVACIGALRIALPSPPSVPPLPLEYSRSL